MRACRKWMAIIVMIAVLGSWIGLSFNTHDVTITVTSTDRVLSREKSKWLILGIDEHGDAIVLENTDNLLRLKFNSSDIQATVEVGKTYKAEVVGIRFRPFSWYENVIEMTEQ